MRGCFLLQLAFLAEEREVDSISADSRPDLPRHDGDVTEGPAADRPNLTIGFSF